MADFLDQLIDQHPAGAHIANGAGPATPTAPQSPVAQPAPPPAPQSAPADHLDALINESRQRYFQQQLSAPPPDAEKDKYIADRWSEFGRGELATRSPDLLDFSQRVFGNSQPTDDIAAEYLKRTADPSVVSRYSDRFGREYEYLKLLKDRNDAATTLAQQYRAQTPPEQQNDEGMYRFVHQGLMATGKEYDFLPPFTVQGGVAQHDVGRMRGLMDAFVRGSGSLAYKPAEFIEGAGRWVTDNMKFGMGTEPDPSDPWKNAPQQHERGFFERLQQNTMAADRRMQEAFPQSTVAQQNPHGVQSYLEQGTEMVPLLTTIIATGGAASAGGGGLLGLEAGTGEAQLAAKVISNGLVFGQEAGGTYNEIYQSALQHGMTPEKANNAAMLGGTISGAVNTYLMKYGAVGQAEKLTLRNAANHMLLSAIAQGKLGAVQDAVRQVSNYATTGQDINVQRILDAGLSGAVTGTGIAAVGVAGRAQANAELSARLSAAGIPKDLHADIISEINSQAAKDPGGQVDVAGIVKRVADQQALLNKAKTAEEPAPTPAAPDTGNGAPNDRENQPGIPSPQQVRPEPAQTKPQPGTGGGPAGAGGAVQGPEPGQLPFGQGSAGAPEGSKASLAEGKDSAGVSQAPDQADAPAPAPETPVEAAVRAARERIGDLNVVDPKSQRQRELVEAGKRLGKDVVFYDSKDRNRAFVHQDHPDVLFVHTRNNSPDALRQALGDEIAETFTPEQLQAIRSRVPKHEFDIYREGYVQQFENTNGASAADKLRADPDRLDRGAIALMVGRIGTKGAMWRRMLGDDPTLADHVAGIIDKVRGVGPLNDAVAKAFDEVRGGKASSAEPVPEPVAHAEGAKTTIKTQTEDVPARYAVIEAADLKPSHDPDSFLPNSEYRGVNERDYSQDKAEQIKVIQNSGENFDSRFALSDDPGPANGPPMVLSDGSVMGGNSRAMTLARVYDDPARAQQLREDTLAAAGKFGLKAEDLDGYKQPVIVRILGESAPDADRLAALSRILQKGHTQELSAGRDAASRAKLLTADPNTLPTLEGLLENGDSVREVLGSNGKATRLLKFLQDVGVITPQEVAKYTTPDGRFSDEGKKLVENVLTSAVIQDPRLLEDTPQQIVNKITGNLADLSFARTRDGWDLGGAITDALTAYHRARAATESAQPDDLLAWLDGKDQLTLTPDPIESQPQAKALFRSLVSENSAQFKARVKKYAEDARSVMPGQERMFGQDVTPKEAFGEAFEKPLPADEDGKLRFLPTPADVERDELLKNVRMDKPDDPTLFAKVKAVIAQGKGPKFEPTWLDRRIAEVQNSLRPIFAAVEQLRDMRGVEEGTAQDPERLIRNLAGATDKEIDAHRNGLRDAKGERVTDSQTGETLTDRWLLGAYDQKSLAAMRAAMGDAMALGIAERTVEKSAQKNRVGNLSGIGQGNGSDLAVAQRFINTLKAEPKRYQQASEGLRRYRLWADAALQYAADKGYISAEDAQRMRDANQFYVNFGRVFDPTGMGPDTKGTGMGRLLAKFKGSERLIDNPIVNLMASSDRLIRAADRNFAYAQLTKLIGDTTKIGSPNATSARPDIGQRVTAETPGRMEIRVDVEKQYWHFQTDVHKALEGLSRNDPVLLGGILKLPGRVLREGVVNNPGFALMHFIRENASRAINSDFGTKPWDFLKGFSKEELSDYRAFGGGMGKAGEWKRAQDAYHDHLAKLMNEAAGDPNVLTWIPRKVADAWRTMKNYSDVASRMVEYKAALKWATDRGMSDYEAKTFAAGKARDLHDYAVSGTILQSINRLTYFPFINADVQGIARYVSGVRENPGRAFVRWGLYALAPSLAAMGWAKRHGKDAEEEYRNLSPWRRDFFWNFKVGDMYVSVPKPFGAGVLGSGAERLIDRARGDQKAFDGFPDSLQRSFFPVGSETLEGPLRAWFDNKANYDSFFDRPIVPPWEDKLNLDLRNADHASRLGQALQWSAQKLGATGKQWDARRIDHLISGFGGGVGNIAKDVSDIGREDREPSRFLTSVGRVISVPSALGSRDIKDALETAESLNDGSSKPVELLHAAVNRVYESKGLQSRNQSLKDARAIARQLNQFYERHGDDLLHFEQEKMRADHAEQQLKKLTGEEREAFIEKNADLIERGRYLDAFGKKIHAVRQQLMNPDADEQDRSEFNRLIDELFKQAKEK